jgi:hypothetical protein
METCLFFYLINYGMIYEDIIKINLKNVDRTICDTYY